MYFSSKKDIWFSFIIWGIILLIILIYIFGGEPIGRQLVTYKSIPGYIISALILTLLLWIWFGTGYRIEGKFLKVRHGPLNCKIKIKEIKKIRRTNNPFIAPALSVDRLEILFGKYDVINISPKSESEFINSLLIVNPNIQLDDISLKPNKN
ncbi:MAG TPA: PH domain-containing protein [Candidatus Pseudogracilibacillus intestinigallinarum]|uniref:PH domain-containing protein n=1 Tax=Candidatus Pseudogracilibacillus intestinigallinarum TaxID=2838742 RepID=A0A9D1PP67_9BACI|nr:PH domain-containing protein [Candidatus Pseudogracilibacillus intestinigallinarum]